MKTVGYVLLMGGKSSRMGRDKAFLLYHGTHFWKKIADEMMKCGPTYLSLDSINRAPDTDCSLILDEYSSIGPIGGIYAGLLKVKEELVFVAPCDMPVITAELMHAIVGQYEDEYDGVILSGKDGRRYPTIGVYSKRLLPIIRDKIKNNDYRLMKLVNEQKFKVIPVETLIPEFELMNLNTWEDYLEFERRNTNKITCPEEFP